MGRLTPQIPFFSTLSPRCSMSPRETRACTFPSSAQLGVKIRSEDSAKPSTLQCKPPSSGVTASLGILNRRTTTSPKSMLGAGPLSANALQAAANAPSSFANSMAGMSRAKPTYSANSRTLGSPANESTRGATAGPGVRAALQPPRDSRNRAPATQRRAGTKVWQPAVGFTRLG